MRDLARTYTTEAIKTLAMMMDVAPLPRDRISAANALLDRGHGRPASELQISHTDKTGATSPADLVSQAREAIRLWDSAQDGESLQ